jgi:nucleoside-diphosphate-sugar epimerase
MKILVTGGAGYVGAVLTETLVDAGYDVTVFDSLAFGVQPILHLADRARIVQGDVRDADAVRRAVSDADAVIHLAAVVGFPACTSRPIEARQINVDGTCNVADALSNSQHLIFASTGSTYGLIAGECTEESPTEPLSLYGQTKLEAEAVCRDKGGTSLRFATLFGLSPCMRFDLLVNTFVYRAIRDRYLVLYEGGHKRTFLHVLDAVDGYLLVLAQAAALKGDVFNVGWGDLNYTKRAIAEAVDRYYGFYIHEAEVGNDLDCRDYHVNYDKVAGIGFRPHRSLSFGIPEVGKIVPFISADNRWRIQ